MQEWLTAPGELDLEMMREWALWLTEVERRLGTRFAQRKAQWRAWFRRRVRL